MFVTLFMFSTSLFLPERFFMSTIVQIFLHDSLYVTSHSEQLSLINSEAWKISKNQGGLFVFFGPEVMVSISIWNSMA